MEPYPHDMPSVSADGHVWRRKRYMSESRDKDIILKTGWKNTAKQKKKLILAFLTFFFVYKSVKVVCPQNVCVCKPPIKASYLFSFGL